MSREDPQMKIRIPEDLRDRIATVAAVNKRSLNAEILARLEESFLDTVPKAQMEQRLAELNAAHQSIEAEIAYLRERLLQPEASVVKTVSDMLKDDFQRYAEEIEERMAKLEGDRPAVRKRQTDVD